MIGRNILESVRFLFALRPATGHREKTITENRRDVAVVRVLLRCPTAGLSSCPLENRSTMANEYRTIPLLLHRQVISYRQRLKWED